MELRDLSPTNDPKGGASSSKTPTPLPIRRARLESDESSDEVLSGIKSEWRWRGKTEQQIKDIQKTADETRDDVKGLGTKIESLQLALQAQVTKMVMISGMIIWISSLVTSVVAGYVIKILSK